MLANILNQLYNLLLPPTCMLCLQRADNTFDLCSACSAELPWLHTRCYRCANPLTISTDSLCGACLKKPPPFQRTIALFNYQPPIDHWLVALKFHHKLIYAQLFGELLAEQLRYSYQTETLPELIIPVPLHNKRLIERGYNQTVEIAKVLHQKLQIPLDRRRCKRVRATKPQLALPAAQRQKNVKHAFALTKPLPVTHIAIVDDVVTTGSTVTEIARLLLKQGVKRVDIWCAARA